jgi:hypothetical protein
LSSIDICVVHLWLGVESGLVALTLLFSRAVCYQLKQLNFLLRMAYFLCPLRFNLNRYFPLCYLCNLMYYSYLNLSAKNACTRAPRRYNRAYVGPHLHLLCLQRVSVPHFSLKGSSSANGPMCVCALCAMCAVLFFCWGDAVRCHISA